MSFNGKVVLITGGSSGIGADAARHLAKRGAKIAIVGRNEKRLNEVAEQINKSSSSAALSIVADVTKDAERIVNETIKHFGRLDVLINNAGISAADMVPSIDMDQFDQIFEINLRSVVNLTKLCVSHLEKTKGNIVNVSSLAAMKPMPNCLTYGMTKAALDQFTKCSALDLAAKGIRVNSINPAAVRTPIFEKFGLKPEQTEFLFEQLKTKYPIGRGGEVSDTSAAIAFLADDKTSSFLTGVLIPVDGGAILAGAQTRLSTIADSYDTRAQ